MSPMQRPNLDTDDIRERILKAAEGRFRSFGYGKTTMAEIAADCDMSAANIYRFFEYKQGIAVALAKRDLRDLEQVLKKVVNNTEWSSRERLKQLFLTNSRYLHECWSKLPRFHELVDDVCAARPDIVREHADRKQAMVLELLITGRERGEFEFDDEQRTAQAVIMATKVFVLPMCINLFSIDELEQRLPLVIDTLIDGFAGSSVRSSARGTET